MHEGHRQRMYGKLKNGSNLYEHEVLEILLYNINPRKDTNPVAHALLERFPSIAAVLRAEVDELASVEGVGEQTALYLKCIGKCFEYVNDSDSFAIIKNRSDLSDFVKLRLSGKRVEILELYALDKNGKIFRIKSFTSNENDRVDMPPDEIMKFISLVKPYSLVAAHNHTAGGAQPSPQDDKFTKQIQLICSLNNVYLRDHMILADGDIYSYYDSGKLTEIQDGFSIGNILKDEI